jgi:hypothetical protein
MSGGKSEGSNETLGTSFGQTFVDPRQRGYLKRLREMGLSETFQQMNKGDSAFNQVESGALSAFGNLIGGQQTPFQYEQNPFLQGQIQQGQRLINRNLQENIMPTIGSGAAQAGQLGGSRQGVAEGIAARGAIESQADLAQNLLGADFERQQSQNFQRNMLGQQQQLQALGQAGNLAGIGFAPLQQLAGLIGDPTLLSKNRSEQIGQGSSDSKSLGF